MKTKICTSCNQSKDISCFSYKNKKKNILHAKCKECVKLYSHKHYNKNKDTYKKRARKYSKIYKERNQRNTIKYLKEHPCKRCGITDIEVLDFHHKNGEEKEHAISNMIKSSYSWNAILKEIEKCVVVCANCHRKIHNKHNNSYRLANTQSEI